MRRTCSKLRSYACKECNKNEGKRTTNEGDRLTWPGDYGRIPPPPKGANQMRAAARVYPSIVLTNAHKTQKRRRDSVHICPRYTCSPWCYPGGADDLSRERVDGFSRERSRFKALEHSFQTRPFARKGRKNCKSYSTFDANPCPIQPPASKQLLAHLLRAH